MKSRVAPTAYAIANGAWASNNDLTEDGEPAGWWWLRSPGRIQVNAADVHTDGLLSINYVLDGRGVIRPAFWLNLESDIF